MCVISDEVRATHVGETLQGLGLKVEGLLASGAQGLPWRLAASKKSGKHIQTSRCL